MATNKITELCKILKGFVLNDKEDKREIFKAIKFVDEYAYASDTHIAVAVKTDVVTEQAEMRGVKGELLENLDVGEYPAFKALLENEAFKGAEPAHVSLPKKGYMAYEWKHILSFIKAMVYTSDKAVILEKRGQELLVFAMNESIKVKTVLSSAVNGGNDICLAVNIKYLAAIAGLLHYLECSSCDFTFTGDVGIVLIQGYRQEDLICTVVLSPLLNKKGKVIEQLMDFRDKDNHVNISTDEEDWDFLEEDD